MPHRLKKLPFKAVLAAAWLVLAGTVLAAIINSGVAAGDIPETLRAFIEKQGAFGPLLYVIIYVLRPLILFPATFLTAASGLLWGPVGGVLYTIVGENLSAMFAFWLGRYFGRDLFAETKFKFLKGLDSRIREHGFMTVLILRLAYMPFDPVNFGCGLTGIRFGEYAAATFLGILPGIVSFVYFGASWFEPGNLVIASAVFVLSLVLAYAVRHTQEGREVVRSAKLAKKP